MTTVPKQPETPAEDFYTRLAANLHTVADAVATLAGRDLPRCNLTVRYYPYGDDDPTNINAIDTFGQAVLGKPGKAQRMGDGTDHHHVDGSLGTVTVAAYRGIQTPEDKAKDEEIARLRAKLAELEGES